MINAPNESKKITRWADNGTYELQSKGEVKYSITTEGYWQAKVTNQTKLDQIAHLLDDCQLEVARILQEDYYYAKKHQDVKSKLFFNTLADQYSPYYQPEEDIEAIERYESAIMLLVNYDQSQYRQGKNTNYYGLIQYTLLDFGYLKELIRANKQVLRLDVFALKKALNLLVRHYGL